MGLPLFEKGSPIMGQSACDNLQAVLIKLNPHTLRQKFYVQKDSCSSKYFVNDLNDRFF